MKKYYRVLKYLDGAQAAGCLSALTDTDISLNDFRALLLHEAVPAYIKFSGECQLGRITPDFGLGKRAKKAPWAKKVLMFGKLQRVCSHFDLFRYSGEDYFFHIWPHTHVTTNELHIRDLEKRPHGPTTPIPDYYVAIELEGDVHFEGESKPAKEKRRWYIRSDAIAACKLGLLFLPKDIEALAAKMNDEPDAQALQIENQRLQQEIEALKTEIERLQAENAQLKAGASVSDEINPRKEDTYLQMIAAMALKLGHDFSASQNGTNAKIRKKLFEIHGKEVLSESVVRNSLNKAKEVLPEALIRPKNK